MKSIIYSPFIDARLLAMILQKARQEDPCAEFSFIGKNAWQKQLSALKYDVPSEAPCFKSDAVVVDPRDTDPLERFIKRNNIELDIPFPKHSGTNRRLNFTAAAVMDLVAEWPLRYKAERRHYQAPDVKSGAKIDVQGYMLHKVSIGLRDDAEVTSSVDIGDGFSITLSDITAFEDSVEKFEHRVKSPYDLFCIQESLDSKRDKKFELFRPEGKVIAPSVSVKAGIADHLKGVRYEAKHPNGKDPENPDKWINEVVIEGSGQLSRLELSEWGVKARSEGYATGRIVFGAAASPKRQYYLEIKHGLVVGIYYRSQLLFTAYVPQSEFKRK